MYLPMILPSPLSSLTTVTRQHFAYIEWIILPMIVSLCLISSDFTVAAEMKTSAGNCSDMNINIDMYFPERASPSR